jgi:hypothetical protein
MSGDRWLAAIVLVTLGLMLATVYILETNPM